ncbi:unnamed protein product [Lampetra fluviatilis]
MAGESPWGDSDLSAFWDYTPLHEVALHGHLLNLTHLLAQGASVNARTRGGVEPLHAACLGGHARCVEALLKGGARVDVVDVEGVTPLLCAARAGSPPCVQLLLGWGASPRAPHPTSPSPLHVAAQLGHEGCVSLLLSAGVEVNSSEGGHGPPLLLACDAGRLACARQLLLAGANPDAGDGARTPLHSAASRSAPTPPPAAPPPGTRPPPPGLPPPRGAPQTTTWRRCCWSSARTLRLATPRAGDRSTSRPPGSLEHEALLRRSRDAPAPLSLLCRRLVRSQLRAPGLAACLPLPPRIVTFLQQPQRPHPGGPVTPPPHLVRDLTPPRHPTPLPPPHRTLNETGAEKLCQTAQVATLVWMVESEVLPLPASNFSPARLR